MKIPITAELAFLFKHLPEVSVAGNFYLVEETTGKLIGMQSLVKGKAFDADIDPNKARVSAQFKWLGIEPAKARIGCYFVPNNQSACTQAEESSGK